MKPLDGFGRFLGQAIRECREGAGLSQEETSHRASVTLRHYQKIEYGRTDPGLDVLLRVAKALDTTLQDLLDRAEAWSTKKKR